MDPATDGGLLNDGVVSQVPYAAETMPKPRINAELALIDQIRTRFSKEGGPGLSLGIGDDCAILRPRAGQEILVTTDFTLEDRHFRRDTHPADAVGHRTLARGLSDLAAMGATPLAAFLSLALPADLPLSAGGRRWIAAFLGGLQALAETVKVPLAGGDTAQSPSNHILADIVLLGTAPTGTALQRSTARPGDLIFVTGSLGGAAAELRDLLARPSPRARTRAPRKHPHLYPEPRLAIGQTLRRRRLATAAIDLSDGLSTDLTHLCEASGLRAELDAVAIPRTESLELALHGGEDYELLFSANSKTRMPRQIAGVPITRIGRLLRPEPHHPRITMLHPDKRASALGAGGWEHFRN